MAALSPAPSPAPVITHNNDPAQGNYFDPQELTTPTIVIIVVACIINVGSILMVSRYLYMRWKSAVTEPQAAPDSPTAQQDKDISLMESQLRHTTPIVVLQPDSRVMCAHKDAAFLDAIKPQALQPDGLKTTLNITVSTPHGPPALPMSEPSGLITDSNQPLHALPQEGAFSAGAAAGGSHHDDEAASTASNDAHSAGITDEHDDTGSAADLPPSASAADLQALAQQDEGDHVPSSSAQSASAFSHRHHNGSAVSLASMAGSDLSSCSTTYVTELPYGASLFYEGSH